MEIPEILRKTENNDGAFARAVVAEAVARRDEVIPSFLHILERVADDSDRFAPDQDHLALIHAMFLMAQFREPRASPLLVRIFSSLAESDFDLIGDLVTEKLGSILASVSNGDLSGMKALIENEQAGELVHSAAMRGLLTVVAHDPSMRVGHGTLRQPLRQAGAGAELHLERPISRHETERDGSWSV